MSMMKTSLRSLALIPALFLVSCYDSGMYYPDGGFGGGFGGFGGPVGGYVPPGYGFGGFGGPVGPYGYRPIGGGFACSRCQRNPCCCGRSGHGHQQVATRSSSSSSNDRRYRILAGDLNGKARPNDFHSLDWYHSRGYSLENLKIETDRGAVIDKRPSSQRSSSSSNSSRRVSSSNSNSSSRSKSSSSGSSSSKSSSNKSSSNKSSGNIREQMKAQLSRK